MALRAVSGPTFLAPDVAAEALAALGTFAVAIGGAAAVFGTIFVPSPNSTSMEGPLPGGQGLSYHYNHDEGVLRLRDLDGNIVAAGPRDQSGIFHDADTGIAIGRGGVREAERLHGENRNSRDRGHCEMTLDFNATSYYSQAHWYRRREDAASIATRLEHYLDKLAEISPLLADMFIRVRTAGVPFAIARLNLTSLVQKTAERDGKGRTDAADGFTIGSLTRRKDNNFSVSGFVGRDYRSPDMNNIMLSTISGYWPDPALMTYALFRAALLAAIECWDPLLCTMQPSTLQPYMARGSWYCETWMTYVHPSLVHRVSPPEIPVVEPTPDGGLLLAATTETFDVDNPDHLEAARRICRATRHFDEVMPRLT